MFLTLLGFQVACTAPAQAQERGRSARHEVQPAPLRYVPPIQAQTEAILYREQDNLLQEASNLRDRLSRLATDIKRDRQKALLNDDIILASCLVPFEKRAEELGQAATVAHSALDRALNPSLAGSKPARGAAGDVIYQRQVLEVLPSIERRVREERSQCRGSSLAVYVEGVPEPGARGLIPLLSRLKVE